MFQLMFSHLGASVTDRVCVYFELVFLCILGNFRYFSLYVTSS